MGWALGAFAAPPSPPAEIPLPAFHLTARPWQASGIKRDALLEVVDAGCRALARLQDKSGAIIDPDLRREHQYGTPYFAFAVGVLLEAGRTDLRENGIRAMNHATAQFAAGVDRIPDRHSEFFDATLPAALPLYEKPVSAEIFAGWRGRLKTPREKIVQGPVNNWRAYAMRGEWQRARLSMVDEADTLRFIRDEWFDGGQRSRIFSDLWNLYQDRGTDPDSLAVEAVGRVNLLDLIESGYTGEAADEIRSAARRGTTATLLLQDPSGQCPPNGRADNHVWNDVLYQLGFELMAEHAWQEGDRARAGRFRRAAQLSFQSIRRWLRSDEEGAGLFFVTKNHFPSRERVGYQAASHVANYNGAVLLHLAQAWLTRKTEIPETPCPAEIGGYAFSTGDTFSTASANAGGMQLVAALRGDRDLVYGHYWTALGVERLGRVGWDTRLGPSDGIRDATTRHGVTFAPTWKEDGKWIRLADVPERYRGEFSVQFVHPLLVRCAIDYRPIQGTGPAFRHEFILTPDGILATLRGDATEFGVTCPLLENDGRPLLTKLTERTATTAYDAAGDQQCFLLLGDAPQIVDDEAPVLSSYGWLRPVRMVTPGREAATFVYPRNAQDPDAEAVVQSFRLNETGYSSPLGRVEGNLYVGRTSAGGEGARIDCDNDGRPDAEFSDVCRFILQLHDGRITAIETDRDTRVRLGGRHLDLRAHTPFDAAIF